MNDQFVMLWFIVDGLFWFRIGSELNNWQIGVNWGLHGYNHVIYSYNLILQGISLSAACNEWRNSSVTTGQYLIFLLL